MKLLAKRRSSSTLPRLVFDASLRLIQFDGYTFTLHFLCADDKEVRVQLERDEAVRVAAQISEEITKQRATLAELRRVTDALG